jgi:hypothetical protein
MSPTGQRTHSAFVLVCLNECREFVECHPPAGFIVNWRDARRQVVVYGEHIRAAVRVSEGERDHHLAAHRGVTDDLTVASVQSAEASA